MKTFVLCLVLTTAVLIQPAGAAAPGRASSGQAGNGYRSGTMSVSPSAPPAAQPPVVMVYVPVAVALPGAALPTRPEQRREVTVLDGSFSPSELSVPAGTVVLFKNKGQQQHTATFSPLLDSGPLAPEGEYRLYCPYPGTYHYHCKIHPDRMKGTITVY